MQESVDNVYYMSYVIVATYYLVVLYQSVSLTGQIVSFYIS